MKKLIIAAALLASTAANASTVGENQVKGAMLALRVVVNCPQLNLNVEKAVANFEQIRISNRISREHASALASEVDVWQRQVAAEGDFCRIESERLISSGYVNFIR